MQKWRERLKFGQVVHKPLPAPPPVVVNMNPIRAELAETPAPCSAQERRMDLFTIRVTHQERSLHRPSASRSNTPVAARLFLRRTFVTWETHLGVLSPT